MALEKTDDAIAAVITKLSALTDAHAGDAALLAGKVLQVQNTSYICAGVPLFLGGVFAIYKGWRWLIKAKVIDRSPRDGGETISDRIDREFRFQIGGEIATIAGCIAALIGFLLASNLSTWYAAFDPQFALAMKILGKL